MENLSSFNINILMVTRLIIRKGNRKIKMISTRMKSRRRNLRLCAMMLLKESKLCKKIPKKNLTNEFIKFNNRQVNLISLLSCKIKV